MNRRTLLRRAGVGGLAAVMVAAPLLFSALAAGIDPGIASFLFHSSAGALCLASGLMLDMAGGWWMHRLTVGTS